MDQLPLLFAVVLTAFAVWAIMAVFGPWWAGGFFVIVAAYELNRERKANQRPER